MSNAWGGSGPLPGVPLFVLTHQVPQQVPHGEPPYTFVTDGIASAVEQARAAAGGRDVLVPTQPRSLLAGQPTPSPCQPAYSPSSRISYGLSVGHRGTSPTNMIPPTTSSRSVCSPVLRTVWTVLGAL